MTPGEYKNGGENLSIKYSRQESPFGMVNVASTDVGICHLSFTQDDPVKDVLARFPNACISNSEDPRHTEMIEYIKGINKEKALKLHVEGTAFQLKVWKILRLGSGIINRISFFSISIYLTI